MESALSEIKSELSQLRSQLAAYAQRLKDLEQNLSDQTTKLECQIRELNSPRQNSESFITLEEGSAVNLEEIERKWEERLSLLSRREKELRDLEKEISEEFEKLRTEVRERYVLWAARSRQPQSPHPKKRRGGRLVSFLVDMGKKHRDSQ